MNMNCDACRATIQDRIDGRLMESAELAAMERHLESCDACGRFQDDMVELHEGLAALPDLEFPDDALETVWDSTIRKPAGRVPGHWRWMIAAAAVLLMALAGGYFGLIDEEPEYSSAEIARATAEARTALGLAGRALQRSQDVAMEKVLGGQVAPALEKITIGLPSIVRGTQRRTGT